MKNNYRGLSLIEVLIATVIIAVAVYGMITTLTAQQIAEGRLRDKQVLTRLHQQFIREFLKNQRNRWTIAGEVYTAPDSAGQTVLLATYAIGGFSGGGERIRYSGTRRPAPNDAIIDTNMWMVRTSVTPAVTLASSSITINYPYNQNNGDWDAVRP